MWISREIRKAETDPLTNTIFLQTPCSEQSGAFAKGITNGVLDFTLEEAIDYFCRNMFMNDIHISKQAYQKKFRKAFILNKDLTIDDIF